MTYGVSIGFQRRALASPSFGGLPPPLPGPSIEGVIHEGSLSASRCLMYSAVTGCQLAANNEPHCLYCHGEDSLPLCLDLPLKVLSSSPVASSTTSTLHNQHRSRGRPILSWHSLLMGLPSAVPLACILHPCVSRALSWRAQGTHSIGPP